MRFNYMTTEDEAVLEILRLGSPRMKRANTEARWNNVYRMWQEGKTLDEIATWIGRTLSTAKRVLKRAARYKQTQPGFQWPVDASGRRVCDLAHPMGDGEFAYQWSHPQAVARKPRSLDRNAEPTRAYCPVCGRTFSVPQPLWKVLTQS